MNFFDRKTPLHPWPRGESSADEPRRQKHHGATKPRQLRRPQAARHRRYLGDVLNSRGKKTTAKRPVPHRRLKTASMWCPSNTTLRGLLLNASSRIVNLTGAATPKQEKCSGSCHAALREHGPPTDTGASQEVPPTTIASTGRKLRSARTVRHQAGHRHARCLCFSGPTPQGCE